MKHCIIFTGILLLSQMTFAQLTQHIDTTLMGMKEVTEYEYDREQPDEVKYGYKYMLNEKAEKQEKLEYNQEEGKFFTAVDYVYKDGNLVQEDYYANGSDRISYSNRFDYNDKRQLVKVTYDRPYRVSTYAYDDQNRKIMEVQFNRRGNDTIFYEYNDDNNSMTQWTAGSNGRFKGSTSYFDEQGEVIRIESEENGQLCSKYYTRDGSSEIMMDSCRMRRSETKRNKAGALIYSNFTHLSRNSSNELIADENTGLMLEENVIKNGEIVAQSIHEYEYDENNNPVVQKIYRVIDGKKELFQQFIKTFDDKGNWITSEFYNYVNGTEKLVSKKRREIVYF